MYENEHERLSNFTLRTKIKVKEQCFYCCSTFHSQSRVLKNENNSIKNECETTSILRLSGGPFSVDKRNASLYTVYLCFIVVMFPR